MKRVILSGGGTGGHIYPAITIAKEIAKLEETEFLFVGTPNGMESRIIPKEGYRFASLPASGLKRKLTLENISILCHAAGSLFKARRILKDFAPDVVIGTGGYVCGPILMAAALSHIPTLIQEQNVIPGITNKILSRVVDKIALGYEAAAPPFPASGEMHLYRKSDPSRHYGSQAGGIPQGALGLSPDTFMVLVTGGSRGARTINTAMLDVHRHFKDAKNLCLYHVTGELEYDKITSALGSDEDGHYGSASRIIRYEYHMPNALAAADLIICRAGAISLAEVAARELPAILIPYPYAAEDHQTYNARVFSEAGAAKMILDKDVTGARFIENITALREHPEDLRTMEKSIGTLKKVHAGEDIARLALSLIEVKEDDYGPHEVSFIPFHRDRRYGHACAGRHSAG